jgi:hypothetical protein
MDIGREVRRYRAESVTSPVPGEAAAPEEPAVRERPAERGEDTPQTQEVAAEASA